MISALGWENILKFRKHNQITSKLGLDESKYKTLILKTFWLLVFIILYLITLYIDSNCSKYLLLFTIVTNIILLYRFRHSQPILLFFLFVLTYSLYLLPYFFKDIPISYYKEYQNIDVFSKTISVQATFVFCLFIFTKKANTSKSLFVDNIKVQNYTLLYYATIIIMVLIIIFGRSGENIFAVGYGKNQTNDFMGLSVYEYFLLFVILSYYYSNRSLYKIIIIIFLCASYSIKGIMFGGRIEVIQLLILIFILFFDGKFRNKFLIITFICLIYLNNLFGIYRGNPEAFWANSNLKFFSLGSNGAFASNQGDVFYSSSVLIGLLSDGIIDFSFRIKSFLGFLSQIVMPSRFIPGEAILSSYSQRLSPSGGGGLISAYFYIWGGILGVVIVAWLISKILNNFHNTTNIFLKFYFLLALSTYPRWFAYSPIVLFKLCLYIVPLLFMYKTFEDFNLKLKGRVDYSTLK